MTERRPSPGLGQHLVQAWGVTGVASILGKGVKRVLPIALEPIRSSASRSRYFWGCYTGFALFMAYVEGYKGFHKHFSPNVVARSSTLHTKGWLTRILAPLYCMELFDAPANHVVRAWSFLSAITLVVAVVKRLPSNARAILDTGVCTGLSVGILSLFYHYASSVIMGGSPNIDFVPSTDSSSICPVAFLTNVINSALDICARRILGKSVQLPQMEGSKTKKCPISNKIGDCPVAKVVDTQIPKSDDESAVETAEVAA